MIIRIENVPDSMTDNKQAEIGQALLITLIHHGVEIDGVAVRFEEEF